MKRIIVLLYCSIAIAAAGMDEQSRGFLRRPDEHGNSTPSRRVLHPHSREAALRREKPQNQRQRRLWRGLHPQEGKEHDALVRRQDGASIRRNSRRRRVKDSKSAKSTKSADSAKGNGQSAPSKGNSAPSKGGSRPGKGASTKSSSSKGSKSTSKKSSKSKGKGSVPSTPHPTPYPTPSQPSTAVPSKASPTGRSSSVDGGGRPPVTSSNNNNDAGTDCLEVNPLNFLVHSANQEASPVYVDVSNPETMDYGTQFIYNDMLLDAESREELDESYLNGVCTRTQQEEELENGDMVAGGGYCTFTFTLYDGIRYSSFNAAGEIFDAFGGELAIAGGTGNFLGVTGQLTLTPVDIDSNDMIVLNEDDIFTEPALYAIEASIIENKCMPVVS